MASDLSSPAAILATLGITDAPVPRAAVAAALAYFASRMPALPGAEVLGFLRGMDLHSAVPDGRGWKTTVREVGLSPPTTVAAFRYSTQNPYRLFYTRAGTSVDVLGINPAGRSFKRFKVVLPVQALESRCIAARESWTDPDSREAFAGGGIQYIIPQAEHVLTLMGPG
jgi:hypothetical protein